jgi:hypothetical protein
VSQNHNDPLVPRLDAMVASTETYPTSNESSVNNVSREQDNLTGTLLQGTRKRARRASLDSDAFEKELNNLGKANLVMNKKPKETCEDPAGDAV